MTYSALKMGKRIRKLREDKELSQADVAKRARISREYLLRLEAGRYDPTLSVAIRLARVLGCSVEDLAK